MLVDRATYDYSPLRGPIINPHTGRDLRPKWERQKYEAAVNSRREMLGWIASTPKQKMSKREHEAFKRAGLGSITRDMVARPEGV